jgi:hypothetical protein
MTEAPYTPPDPRDPKVSKFQYLAKVAKRLKTGQGTAEDTLLLLREPLLAIILKFKA